MNPGTVIDCESIARDLMRQREFFEFHRDELPEQSRLPVLAAARYTGGRSDDEQTNLRVGAMRLLGMSDRAIERECGVDRRTIPHRLAWLAQTGRIPAAKDRVATVTSDLAESSGLVLRTLMDRAGGGEVSMDLASMIKAVATLHGITVEKMQLLTGGATERIETTVGAGAAERDAWLRANAITVEVLPAANDLASTIANPFCEQTVRIGSGRPGHDTSSSADPVAAGTGDLQSDQERRPGGGSEGRAVGGK
jgi:hypothetical protein